MNFNNPLSLDGKNFLITGAASGIGRATSILLSKLGSNLILIDINYESLQETLSLCKQTDIIIGIDLTDFISLKKEITNVVQNFGKLNGFVHLAGIPYISPLKSVTEEKCKEVFSINTYAAIELAKIFSGRNVCNGEKGSIVLVSSVYGFVGTAANVGYAMSKSALHGITKSLAIEMAGKGIRVNCIAPGFVKTNMLVNNNSMFDSEYYETLEKLHPLGLGEPEDVAYLIAFLLSDLSKWITGSIINIDGGFTAQ